MHALPFRGPQLDGTGPRIERPLEAVGLSKVSPDRPLIGSGGHFYDSENEGSVRCFTYLPTYEGDPC